MWSVLGADTALSILCGYCFAGPTVNVALVLPAAYFPEGLCGLVAARNLYSVGAGLAFLTRRKDGAQDQDKQQGGKVMGDLHGA